MGYSFPKLHEGKKWFVDFVCYDPLTQTMRRKKYHVDNFKTKKERRAYAAELIATLSAKLRTGWNVWAAQAETVREYTPIEKVRELWLTWIERLAKVGTLRPASVERKRSFAKVFFAWLDEECPVRVVYVYQLTRDVMNDFLDSLLLDKEVKPLTRNNYRTWLVTFCEFLVDKRFAHENVAQSLKVMKETEPVRDALKKEDVARLRAYLVERGERHFLLACMLEYYCFIRPKELTFLRVGDFSVKGQYVVLSGEWTKNRRDAKVAVNGQVLKLMVELGVFKYPSGHFLFGTKMLCPGTVQQTSHVFRTHWLKVRKALGWGEELQFYSLKYSGIRDLANAEGIVVARDQARHSDVATTNKYLKGDALAVHEEVKRFRGGL